jgi:ferritin heavy chain
MAQAAAATAPGALCAFSSSTAGNAPVKASSVNVVSWKSQPRHLLTVRASGSENAEVGYAKAETCIVFEPFAEVQGELVKVSSAHLESLARQRFSPSCEAAINDQINVEYNVSYVYHALYAFFDRDNVGLPGFAKFFKESSEEEREHAEKLMQYQNKRGGRVKLNTIQSPVMEFDHAEKGDALYSMELALAMEKLVSEKLLSLHQVAADNNDPEMCDFIEGEFLNEQVEAIKKIAGYVSQLRRVGKGHGVYHFDLQLQE